jgi:hypothetical protein
MIHRFNCEAPNAVRRGVINRYDSSGGAIISNYTAERAPRAFGISAYF